MSEPTYPPPIPPGAEAKASSRATTSMILGILGIVCCQICAPFAWYMGKEEIKAIKAGSSPVVGQGFATAGMVMGIIGTIFLVFGLLWIVFFGGLAFLSAFTGAASQ